MAKMLKYIHRTVVTEQDMDGNTTEREVLTVMSVPDTESGRALAEKEAYGEITPYDDGMPEPVSEPTTDDVINALLGVTSNE